MSKETQAVLKSQIVAMEVASNEQYVQHNMSVCSNSNLLSNYRSKEYQATLKILETKKVKI